MHFKDYFQNNVPLPKLLVYYYFHYKNIYNYIPEKKQYF